MTAVADVLNGAADLIERDGWCQAKFRGPNGEHCAADALMRAAGTKPGVPGSAEQSVLYSRACGFLTYGSITAEPLEVIQTANRVDGTVWFVLDAEHQFLWNRVEVVERRLTCWCEAGQNHAEYPDTEPPCPHLRAVVDERMAAQRSAGPKLGALRPSTFVD